MPTYLAIDYGTKRIGLAISAPDSDYAIPLPNISSRGNVEGDVAAILEQALNYQIDSYVVGLPLNMDGTEGPQAKKSRNLGDALANQSGAPVEYWDERLSSVSADELLRSSDLTRDQRRARQDGIAAQVFLEDFLRRKPERPAK